MRQELTSAPRRCAIYTRKSTNIRLDADVNSLTTQHEICAAYVASQQYRSWVLVPKQYDDGGHSGSGLERPALAALMHDIEAGEIDLVVVYKIDRLTRSLVDFVRLIDLFDRRGIGLVSVSQAFDTSDSMGRMILNVLLTFSQFERELISERVRDSIRTRKRHGKVHGGLAPFGYEYAMGDLRLVDAEAEIVRFVFAAFLRRGTYTAVMSEVRELGLCSSVKTGQNGASRGGKPMSPGTVYNILRNPIYVGEIRGHDRNWPGRHQPIIDRETWDAACDLVKSRTKKGPSALGSEHFLAGILYDDLGRHMLLDLGCTDGRSYNFYVSSNAQWAQAQYQRQYRTRADRLDAVVMASCEAFLSNRQQMRAALRQHGHFGAELDKLASRAQIAAERVSTTPPTDRSALFAALIAQIDVGLDALSIHFRLIELRRFLEWEGQGTFVGRKDDWPLSDSRYVIEVPVQVVAPQRYPPFPVQPRNSAAVCKPDKQLNILLSTARAAQHLFERQRDLDLAGLARRFGRSPGYFSRLLRLNYLAPDIVAAIVDGTQPPRLDRKTLASAHIPLDWAVQRRMFGFPEPTRPTKPRNLFGRGDWPSKP